MQYVPTMAYLIDAEDNNVVGIVDLFKSYFSYVYETNRNNIPSFNSSTSLANPINSINLDINNIFNDL